MAKKTFLDLDLLIEGSPAGYKARVLKSPTGEAVNNFSLPFSDLQIENFLLRISRTQRGVRGLESREIEAARDFGSSLFNAAFGDEVRDCLHRSLDEADRQGAGLRIRLRLADVPELAGLPWEYLYDPAPFNRFLVLSTGTPLVRYLELPERIQPLAVRPPLRILVIISSPSDYPPLEVEKEWANLRAALDELIQQEMVELEQLAPATLAALQRQLRRSEYHILHFVGHGSFDEQTRDGVLTLEDENRRGFPVKGNYLGALLHDHRPLRLALLNACEGGRASRTDPFAGVAQSLVQQGIPAVIAMQFAITDKTAITFAREFYGAIADGYPVDASLTEARKFIYAQGPNVEWGTPVLYMRSPDGSIFDVPLATPEERQRRIQLANLYRQADQSMAEQDWAGALVVLTRIQRLDPSYRDAARLQSLAASLAQGKEALERAEWSRAVQVYQEVLFQQPEHPEAEAGLSMAELMPKLNDEPVGPQVMNGLVRLGPRAIRGLVALIRSDFEAARLPASALNLRTRQQRRAFSILARMQEKEAVDYLNSLTPPGMILIPAGPFLLGSDKYENERPVHEVQVNAFYLARTPVTNNDYRQFIQANGYHQQRYWTTAGWAWVQASRREHPLDWPGAPWQERPNDHPVQYISWYEAMAYVRWLAEATNAPYRLPTEAEWEKAAGWDDQAKKKREYPWGDEFDGRRCNVRGNGPTPVGAYPNGASPYGALDMAGNVWEWTSSLRWLYPYRPDDGRQDLEAGGERVIRGGCWATDEGYARVAGRYAANRPVWPDMNTYLGYDGPCGLRVALGVMEKQL